MISSIQRFFQLFVKICLKLRSFLFILQLLLPLPFSYELLIHNHNVLALRDNKMLSTHFICDWISAEICKNYHRFNFCCSTKARWLLRSFFEITFFDKFVRVFRKRSPYWILTFSWRINKMAAVRCSVSTDLKSKKFFTL